MRHVFQFFREKVRQHVEQKAFDAIVAAADFMVERAQEYAPEDAGALKASIGVVENREEFTCSIMVTAPYALYQEFGWYDISQTWHPPVGFMRKALADTQAEFPNIAVQFKLGEGGRYVSKAPFSQEPGPQRSPRQHTFETEREKRIETEVGSHTGK
jgi:hypothetical protein